MKSHITMNPCFLNYPNKLSKKLYVFDDDYKYNIICGRDFNKLLIMLNNNNLWMEDPRGITKVSMICVLYIYLMCHIKNDDLYWHK